MIMLPTMGRLELNDGVACFVRSRLDTFYWKSSISPRRGAAAEPSKYAVTADLLGDHRSVFEGTHDTSIYIETNLPVTVILTDPNWVDWELGT